MHIAKPCLSRHRRARLIAWALAMLMWMASVLAGAVFTARHERKRGPRMSLAGRERMVKQLIFVRAIDLTRLRQRRSSNFFRYGRDLTPRGLIRAILGSRVRRALKRKEIGERIAMMIHTLSHLDAWAASVAQRMKRRLTRRRAIVPMPAFAAPIAPLAEPCVCFADSS